MGLRPRPRTLLAGLVTVVLLGGSGCGLIPGDRLRGDRGGVDAGGTLSVVVARWPEHLDPQRVGTPAEANLSRLVSRTLTTFRPEPGAAGAELVPDLATDTGRPLEDHTVWEFTLAQGGQWADGEPVTCQDLKYGVERRYSTDEDRQTGSTVPLRYLRDNEQSYDGPWVGGNNDGAGLESVECLDQQVIRYHLAEPVPDFHQAVSLPVFAPVRPGADDGRARYDQVPLSTGPYLVAEHRFDPAAPAENRLVLERNPGWSADSDPHRRAYPDRIVVELTADPAATTNALVADAGADRNRILLDTDVPVSFVQQVMTDPRLRQRVAAGLDGTVAYLAVDTELIPEERCRQALAYGINPRAVRSALGGQLYGELATTMLPPTVPDRVEFDHYGIREFPEGQPARAHELHDQAEAAGVDCPAEVSFAHPDTAPLRRVAAAVADAYRRIGVDVRQAPGDDDGELTWRTASPASPGELQPWGEGDRELVATAAVIPLVYPYALRMHGSNVRGAFIHPRLGMPDLAALGLVDPTLAPPAAP